MYYVYICSCQTAYEEVSLNLAVPLKALNVHKEDTNINDNQSFVWAAANVWARPAGMLDIKGVVKALDFSS